MPTQTDLSERLQALATDHSKRPKAARLLDVIDDVERALAAGVRVQAVVDTLREGGLDMTVGTFKSALSRIRARRAVAQGLPAPLPTAAAPSARPLEPVATVPNPTRADQRPSPSADSPAALVEIMNSSPDLDELARKASKK